MKTDVIIIGGGLAGLACATTLHKAQVPWTLLEASDRIGGRLRTDIVDGFQLDRGFQVLQTAYPEARRMLDYRALELNAFLPGAIFRIGGRFYRVADPRRRPLDLIHALKAPIGTFLDKLRLLPLSFRVCRTDLESLFQMPEEPTPSYLRRLGFSERMIARFFRPFFSGITLDPEIGASSRLFNFVLRTFASGDVALPARGMNAIPQQLASSLPPDSIRTGMRVSKVNPGKITVDGGETLACRCILLAVDAPQAHRLMGESKAPGSHGERCLYFDAPSPPISDKLLVLNADESGPINTLTIPSNVVSNYAPPGRALIAVTVLDDQRYAPDELETAVRNQLIKWYGRQVDDWRLLQMYTIEHALPHTSLPLPSPYEQIYHAGDGIYTCGEFNGVPSIQWALYSGRRAAETVLADLHG